MYRCTVFNKSSLLNYNQILFSSYPFVQKLRQINICSQ